MLKTLTKENTKKVRKKLEEAQKNEKLSSLNLNLKSAQVGLNLKKYIEVLRFEYLLESLRTQEKDWVAQLLQNPDLRSTLLGKITKKKKKVFDQRLGILYFKRAKRNIYLTLCDSQNRIRASLSTGYLKFKGVKLKSKARKAIFNLKKLAHLLVGLILKTKFKKLHLKFKTSFPKKVKKTFLRILGYKRKKFKVCKLSRFRTKPHNGCRRSKMRRK